MNAHTQQIVILIVGFAAMAAILVLLWLCFRRLDSLGMTEARAQRQLSEYNAALANAGQTEIQRRIDKAFRELGETCSTNAVLLQIEALRAELQHGKEEVSGFMEKITDALRLVGRALGEKGQNRDSRGEDRNPSGDIGNA
jgi:CelD/BcsL family acetyltransferase involved in cellulose biosynthesis